MLFVGWHASVVSDVAACRLRSICFFLSGVVSVLIEDVTLQHGRNKSRVRWQCMVRPLGVGRNLLPECRGSWGEPGMDPRGGLGLEKRGPIPSKRDPDGSGAWSARHGKNEGGKGKCKELGDLCKKAET